MHLSTYVEYFHFFKQLKKTSLNSFCDLSKFVQHPFYWGSKVKGNSLFWQKLNLTIALLRLLQVGKVSLESFKTFCKQSQEAAQTNKALFLKGEGNAGAVCGSIIPTVLHRLLHPGVAAEGATEAGRHQRGILPLLSAHSISRHH